MADTLPGVGGRCTQGWMNDSASILSLVLSSMLLVVPVVVLWAVGTLYSARFTI